MFEHFKKFTMMEETNSVATDSTGNNTLLAACAVLEHRPNLQNKKRQGYNKRKERLERLPPHNGYHYGFEDGYRYAIERLQRHSSTTNYKKMFKTITSAAILATLLLGDISVEAQTLNEEMFYSKAAAQLPPCDTIRVLLLVSDTSIISSTVWHEWGYQVRERHCCINGNTSNLAYYQPVPYYEHFMYLDKKMAPLKPGIFVWETFAE